MSFWKTTLPRAVYRLTGGRVLGRIGGRPVLLLQTRGRRTGRTRTTPVQYLLDSDGLVIVASNGGAAHPPAWLLNLRADPHAHVQLGSHHRDVIAREVDEDERAELWRRLTSADRRLDQLERRSGRRMPVLILMTAHAPEVPGR